MPPAPNVHPRQIVQRFNICNQYVIKFDDKMTLEFEKEIPIEECIMDGNFVLTDPELVEIRRTYEAAKKCYKNPKGKRCK